MDVRLLQGVVSPHAFLKRHDVSLHVGKVVRRAREVRVPTVNGKDVTRHVVARSHPFEDGGVAFGNRSELRMSVRAVRGDRWDSDVVNHHPSYQPLSLLMTNKGEMSVKTSLKARGLFGSVGKPGLGSKTTRTAPTVGRPQFPPVAVSCTFPSFTPGIMAVKMLGSKPFMSSK